jgi:hypothetical protein
MRTNIKLILAGAAVAGLAAAGAVAAENSHVLTLRLPDGSQEQIHYAGDVAPKVRILSGPQTFVAFAPMLDPFGPNSPFAAMDRMSQVMDRDAAQMLRQARTLPTGAGGLKPVDLGSMPPGVSGYTEVSTFSGGKMCTHITRYSAGAAGTPAKVLTSSTGDCGPARTGGPEMTAAPVQPTDHAPILTRTGYWPSSKSASIVD